MRPGSSWVSAPILWLRTRRASAALFTANVTSAGVALGVNVFVARHLGPEEYGQYRFVYAIVLFVSLFFDLGYFSSGAYILAGTEDLHRRRLVSGALVAIGLVLAFGFALLTALSSPVVGTLYGPEIGRLLLLSAPLAPAAIAPYFVEQLLKGSGRIGLLAAWTVVNRIGAATVLVVLGLVGRLSAASALVVTFGAGIVATAVVLLLVRPAFVEVIEGVREVHAEQRRFGRPLYVGRSLNLMSYRTDALFLGYFRDATVVGHYALATAFASVPAMFAQAIAAFEFRGFPGRSIARRVLRVTFVGTAVAAVVTAVAVGEYVVPYLGPGYGGVTPILYAAVVAAVFQGAYQPFNSWLLANGRGYALRRLLLTVAGVNLVANAVLIPFVGGVGAAVASGVGTATYLFLAIRAYRRERVEMAEPTTEDPE